MDAANRERLMERFAAYLDAADVEVSTVDADGEDAPDLFTLLAELAALRNEVKLESRQVKSALDQFREALELIQGAETRAREERARRSEAEQRLAHDAERPLMLELLELRDRLQAGHEQALRYRPGWLARHGGAQDFVSGMAEGLAINLRRLDDSLARRGVRPLRVLGRPFDPRTMQAAEIARDPDQPDSLVLTELRPGYLQGERLLRAAEVVVNRRD